MESVLAATVDGGREVGRPDAVAAADPARGRRGRLGRPGPVPAVRGRARERSRRAGRGAGGDGPGRAHAEDRQAVAPAFRSGVAALEDDAFGYETVFILTAGGRASRSTSGRSRSGSRRSATRCSSAATRGWSRSTSTTSGPTRSSPTGCRSGRSPGSRVENLDTMADDVREARATEFVGAVDAAGPDRRRRRTGGRRRAATVAAHRGARGIDPRLSARRRSRAGDERIARPRRGRARPALGPAIVAVVAGDGLEKSSATSASHVVRGGQTANPSTGELLRHRAGSRGRARSSSCRTTRTSVLAARAGRGICADRRVVVVPTRNAAEGVAALLAYDPTLDAAANVGPMTDGRPRRSQTRPGHRGRPRREDRRQEGQEGPDDRARSRRRARRGRRRPRRRRCSTAVDDASRPGSSWSPSTTARTRPRRGRGDGRPDRRAAPGVEVEVVHGGQPHYRYLISAE